MRYTVTKEIESETQVVWFLYFQDMVFLTAWVVMTMILQKQVHTSLTFFFWVYSVVMGVILVLPCGRNPKRRNYQSIVLYFMRPKNIYSYAEIRTVHGYGQLQKNMEGKENEESGVE